MTSANGRLRRGIGANAFALAIRIASQFAIVPVLFTAWSPERVGAWFMLAAFPVLLGLVAQGFAGAAANDALARKESDPGRSCEDAFLASLAVGTAATAVLGLAALVIAPALLEAVGRFATLVAASELRPALALLVAYSVVASWQASLEVPFRCSGRYPAHIALGAGTAGVETLAIALAVVFSGGFEAVAAAMLATRALGLLMSYLLARRSGPLWGGGMRWTAISACTRRLARPAAGFLALALIPALNLQGYALLVGFAFGPAVLAVFVATRTFARLFDVVTGFAFSMQYHEHAHLPNDRALQRRMLATATLAMLLPAAAFSALLMAIGGPLQHAWTGGNAPFDHGVAAMILLAATVRGLAAAPAAALAATNAHGAHTAAYLTGTIASLAAGSLLAWSGAPLTVVLLALTGAELSQCAIAFAKAWRRLDYGWRQFVMDLFDRQRLHDVAMLARYVAAGNSR
jgi:O-antigen/teichoic acid export membrane protein